MSDAAEGSNVTAGGYESGTPEFRAYLEGWEAARSQHSKSGGDSDARDAARYRWIKAHMGSQPMFPLPGEARPRVDVRFPVIERRRGGVEWEIADASRLDSLIDTATEQPHKPNSAED